MSIRNAWHRLDDFRAIRRVPNKAGVYELGNKNKTIFYIGRAEGGNLQDRIRYLVIKDQIECSHTNSG